MYSLGVCLFVMLFKNYPKFREVPSESNPFTISDSKWNARSKQARHLLLRMLETDPKKRANIYEVRTHEWLLSLPPGVE